MDQELINWIEILYCGWHRLLVVYYIARFFHLEILDLWSLKNKFTKYRGFRHKKKSWNVTSQKQPWIKNIECNLFICVYKIQNWRWRRYSKFGNGCLYRLEVIPKVHQGKSVWRPPPPSQWRFNTFPEKGFRISLKRDLVIMRENILPNSIPYFYPDHVLERSTEVNRGKLVR